MLLVQIFPSNIFLFSELNLHALRRFPNIFSAYGGDNFVEHFAKRKEKELSLRYKGALPPALPNSDDAILTPDDYFHALGKDFLYIGDKIATSHRTIDGVLDLDLLKDFLEQEESDGAMLFFTLRRPSENLLAVSKMFPDADMREWGRSIAKTTIAIIESFLRGNRTYLVFHQDIGPSLIGEISEVVGINLPFSPSLVGTEHQATRGQAISLDEPWVSVLDAAFNKFYDLYRCDACTLKHSKTDGLIKQISSIVAQLEAAVQQISH